MVAQSTGLRHQYGGWAKGGPYTGNKYFSPFKNPELHPDSPEGEHLQTVLRMRQPSFIRQNKQNPFLAYLLLLRSHPASGRKDLVEKYKKRAAEISEKNLVRSMIVKSDSSKTCSLCRHGGSHG